MAFPYVFESNFETLDNSEWDSETDTASQLDFPSYKTLARLPWSTAAPFRGAGCMRAVLSGGTADAFVTEGDIDIALAANRFFRFYVWFSPDFTGTANDTFSLFEIQSAGPVIEGVVGGRIVAATDVINLGIGETAATSFSSIAIERGAWYCVELDVTLDSGGGNDGTLDLFITKEGEPAAASVSATQVASLDQAAIIQGVLGIQDHLATTTGTILFDQFVMDDARLFPFTDRYPREVLLTKSSHVFMGNGKISRASLLGGSAGDNVLSIFDTDSSNTDDASNIVYEAKNTAASQLVEMEDQAVCVNRGAFVNLTGSTPRALIQIGAGESYGSSGAVRTAGRARR